MFPSRLPRLAPGPCLGFAYLLVSALLEVAAQPYWSLSYGVLFGALLLTPMRYWLWLLGAEWLAWLASHDIHGLPLGWRSFVLIALPEPLIMATTLALLPRLRRHPQLENPQGVIQLLAAGTLAVAATTAADATLLMLRRVPVPARELAGLLGEALLSHYLGVLLVVPLMLLLLRARPDRQALARLVADGFFVLAPALVVLLVLSGQAPPLPQFARVLALAPVLYFAFRHGWRGASLVMLITSIGLALMDEHEGQASTATAAYLFLAVAGTGALMLGAATDALRRSSARVAEQNRYLGAANRRLDQLTHQLRDAARGNLQADEERRRHLAAELHDELGQNITAIQTHVKLAQSRLHLADLDDIGNSINAILAHMRRTLHRMLDDLRPAVLDEFGLIRALDEGPIRDLLAAAGMHYHTDLHGDPRRLDEDTRTAIYRLVQESSTNSVKHARASAFALRLRIGVRNGEALALLDIRDDGVGLPEAPPRGGRGLQGMRDRVTSLGGQFRLRRVPRGVRLRILLRGTPVPPAEPVSRNAGGQPADGAGTV